VSPPAGQLWGRQAVLVGHGLQAPFPSQVPALLQFCFVGSLLLLAQRDLGSEPSEGTLWQVPAAVVPVVPLPRQVLHRPPVVWSSEQALLQHTPSVQNPVWHWADEVHGAPSTFRPQVSTPEMVTQVLGARQSWAWVATVHVVLHAPATQAKLPQG
jgi:hypothetical protein